MKKLFILLAAVALTAMSAKVFAQTNTGTEPSIGSIHKYWVNGTFETPTEAGETSTYTWWISTTPGNLLTPTALTSDFEVITTNGGVEYNTGTVGGNSIELKWNPTASTTNYYYLVVQEVGVDPLCTNIKAIPILPTNNFTLLFEALASDGTTLTDDPTRCPVDIALSADGADITYNYGTDNFMFKLTASDLYSSWSFVGTFVETINTDVTVEYKIGEAGTFAEWDDEPNLTVPANGAGSEVVYFRVNVNNGTSDDAAFEENLSEKTITLTLSDVEDDGENAVTEITNNAGTDITATPVQTQTIQARPSTTGIQTD
ncbi:hypothetical protein [Mariniphaga sp.]|uniref:hypothetical protein n=1 Tax=Mariniphaga sp. TaxID=1954475 RepID=UPI00356B05DF